MVSYNKILSHPIVKNATWLMAGEVFSRAVKLGIVIYLARLIGPARYGSFAFALSFVSIFVIIADGGLSSIVTKHHARGTLPPKEIADVIGLKLFLSLVAFCVIALASFTVNDPTGEMRRLILVLGGFTIIQNFADIFDAFFRSIQKMRYEATLQIIETISTAAFVWLFLSITPAALSAAYGYMIGVLVAICISGFVFQKTVAPVSFSFNKKIWTFLLKESWPLAFVAFFSIIYNNIDTVMMGYLKQITQVGWYEAGVKIGLIAVLPSALLVRSTFPLLSKAAHEVNGRLEQIMTKLVSSITLFAIPIAVGGIVVARSLMTFLYGAAYGGGVAALRITVISFCINALISAFIFLSVSLNQQKMVLKVSLLGALVNIALNIVLIPHFSLYGAALSTLITMVFMLVTYIVVIRRKKINLYGRVIVSNIACACASAAVMVGMLVLCMRLHLSIIAVILCGGVIYGAVVYWLQRTLFSRYGII